VFSYVLTALVICVGTVNTATLVSFTHVPPH